jgi:hypothetical protein
MGQVACAQISLAGYIKTLGSADAYPTHIDSLQKGGYRIVKDTVERDAITTLRRKIGMLVYVQDLDSMYILKSGIDNSNWIAYSSGSGTAVVGEATSTNTANTIVKRDASGGFAAGTITAALNGNAATATFATTSGTLNVASQPEITSVGVLTGLAVITPIAGSITGNAATASLANNATTATTAINVSGTVGLDHGGTGANNVIAAKTNLGLNNVDNTPDTVKPVSGPTQAALNLKEDDINKSTNTSLGSSDVLFPTQNAVKVYVDAEVASSALPAKFNWPVT